MKANIRFMVQKQNKQKAKKTEINRNKEKILALKTRISLAHISYIYFNAFFPTLTHSARWIPHSLSGGPVPRCRPGGLWLQHPSDRRVHADDHRLHHGGNLRALHAASVSHGVPVALRPLPPPTRGLRRRHIAPKMINWQTVNVETSLLFTESFEKTSGIFPKL